jgi:hypothetical protein
LEAPERYEQLLAFLGSHLPSPVDQHADSDGHVRFIGGDPLEVIVVLTESSVIVSEFAGEWESPMEFVPKPRQFGVLNWPEIPENALWAALGSLIKGARDARRSHYRVCGYCERSTAPEWMHDEEVCQSCAQEHSGSIH